jgi:hypothetical protein
MHGKYEKFKHFSGRKNSQIESPRCGLEDNIKSDLRDIGGEILWNTFVWQMSELIVGSCGRGNGPLVP